MHKCIVCGETFVANEGDACDVCYEELTHEFEPDPMEAEFDYRD